MQEDDKPFECSECGKRFSTEAHLTVHTQKHEMSLNLNSSSKKLTFADQTPTPTRFLKECTDVGLFINPFDEDFRRASQSGTTPTLTSMPNDNFESLNTPCIVPATADINISLLTDTPTPNLSPVILGQSGLNTSSLKVETDNTTPFANSLNEDLEDRQEELVRVSGLADKGHVMPQVVTPKITTSTLINSFMKSKAKSAGQTTVITSVGSCKTRPSNFGGVPTAVVVKPPLTSVQVPASSQVPISQSPNARIATVNTSTRPVLPNKPSISNVQNASMVQLILKMPDGQSMPFNIPVVPGSASPMMVQAVSAPQSTTITTNTQLQMHQLNRAVSQNLLQPQNNSLSTTTTQHIPNSNFIIRQTNSKAQLTMETLMLNNQKNLVATVQPTMRNEHSALGRRKRMDFEDSMPDDEKRRKFLERNRAAATRCRQKRKQWVNELEKRADDLERTNSQLQVRYQSEVAILRREVAQLKTMLLAHKDCPITQQQISAGQTNMETLTSMAFSLQNLCSSSSNGATAISNFASLTGGIITAGSGGDYEIIQVETNNSDLQQAEEIIIGSNYDVSEEDEADSSANSKSFPENSS